MIARVPGLTGLHVGINDLGLASRFEVYALGEVERAARAAAAAGIRFGIGGIGRHDAAGLPVDPDLVYAQYPRLGAGSALLARSFLARGSDLGPAIARARERLAWWGRQPATELERARVALLDSARACATF